MLCQRLSQLFICICPVRLLSQQPHPKIGFAIPSVHLADNNRALYLPQRPEPEIDATIHQYGDYILQPPNADPKNQSNYVWQFSDMFMLSAFLQSQNASQTTLLGYEDAMKPLVALENPSR